MYVRTNNNITWIMIHIEFASKNCYIYCRWKSPRKVARNMRNGLMDTWKMERFGRALRLLTNKLLLRAEWVPQRADWLTGWLFWRFSAFCGWLKAASWPHEMAMLTKWSLPQQPTFTNRFSCHNASSTSSPFIVFHVPVLVLPSTLSWP